jgi:two-component system sensor histidine kinase GlrK
MAGSVPFPYPSVPTAFLDPSRASFRQMLVVAFLLISALLAAASLRSLFAVERLLAESRRGAEREIQVNANVQVLVERSVTMERAARQYLVLNDPLLRERFEAASRDAALAVSTLGADGLPPEQQESWNAQRDLIVATLAGPRGAAAARDPALVDAFRDLDRINGEIAHKLRLATQEQSRTLLVALESSRQALVRQVLGAIVAALVMAVAFGIWLARPLKRLETAIEALGENRLGQPIEVRGPADVRQLGRRLDWLRVRLAELDEDKARFLRHVSHELKTPLAALREGVALLEDGVAGALSDKQRGVARILRENTAQLQGQIEELLRFNLAAFEARKLVRRRTELVGLVTQIAEQQRLQVQARALRLEVSGKPLWVEVDPEKIGTAVANLVSNAIRCTPQGGRIDIAVSEQGGAACIEVTDTGPGVAPADRPRIFEPFFRGDRQPAQGIRGSGIGLSIVQEYVTAHGGRVGLVPGDTGARFRIELPHALAA